MVRLRRVSNRWWPGPPPPEDPPADPELAALCREVDNLAAHSHAIIEDLDNGLASRRYALSCDRRMTY